MHPKDNRGAPLLDRRFLEQLERLTLHWQKSFNGLVGGHNRSRFPGAGQEFLDHRTFYPGDDLRSINWRAYMRFEKLFLKMFRIEPRVPVRILLDVSASMKVPDGLAGAATKFDYARKLAAALVYVGLVRLDSIVLQPFCDRLLDPFLASGGRHRFQPAESYLRLLESKGNTNYFETARQFLTEYPQRGLTVIVSDFLDDRDCFRPLQYLADWGHELMLVQVWTSQERVPDGEGEFELVDAESGREQRVALDEVTREKYTAAFDGHADDLRKLALRNGGRYTGCETSIPLGDALFEALAAGAAG